MATMLLMCSMNIVLATEADTTEIIIEENYDLHVKIKVNTTVETNRLTIKVHGDENDYSEFLFAWQSLQPDSTDQNGVHSYTYDFYANSGTNSGIYNVYVSCMPTSEQPVTFRLRTDADKKAFYDDLNREGANISSVLAIHQDVIPDGLSGYVGLSSSAEGRAMLSLIDDKIADGNYAVQNDLSNLDEIDTMFCTLYTENVLMANLLCEEIPSEWKKYAKRAIDEIGFDGTYFGQLDINTLCAAFIQEKENVLDKASVIRAYEEATLIAVANNFNAQILNSAVEMYKTRANVDLDFADYDQLNDTNKIEVCKTVKDATPNTFIEFKTAFENKAEQLTTANTTPGIQGGSVTGGGGGGTIAGSREETPKEETKENQTNVVFNDIGAYGWAQESILYLAQKGVINGKAEGIYAPGDSVTREEFVKMIIEAFNCKISNASAEFSDVAKDRWSYVYVASAYELGIVSGESDVIFAPGKTISRQDMAVMLERMLNLAKVPINGNAERFADENQISGYAKGAVENLSGLNIINGMGDGTFAPKQSVTRAQAAKVIFESLKLIEN